MAIIDLYSRALEHREDSSSQPVVNDKLPTSVKAIAGVIVVFGLIILGITAWKIGKWRRNKIRAASQTVGNYAPKQAAPSYHVDLHISESRSDEKSHPAFGPEPELEPYKWQPIAFPPPAHSPNKAVTKGPSRFFKSFTDSKKPAPLPLPLAQSPPPAYSAPLITVQVADEKDARRTTPHAALTLQMLSLDPSTPIPSPIRTASIGPDSPLFKSLASAPKVGGGKRASSLATMPKALPRLMAVACTFVPSLPDELAVRVGEPLRMLEEYEDEWCLVQRVGKTDAERGVVPRFCLQEVPHAPPPKRSSLAPSGLARQ